MWFMIYGREKAKFVVASKTALLWVLASYYKSNYLLQKVENALLWLDNTASSFKD